MGAMLVGYYKQMSTVNEDVSPKMRLWCCDAKTIINNIGAKCTIAL